MKRGAALLAAVAIVSPLVLGGPAGAVGSGTWKGTGSLITARVGGTATVLTGPACQSRTPPSWCGRILAVGGFTTNSTTSATSTAEVYDPAAGSWARTAPMATPRSRQTATALADGRVLVAGGVDGSGAVVASAEVYNPASGTWAAAGTMSIGRADHTGTLLSNAKVLIAGGDAGQASPAGASCGDGPPSSELWDPSSGTFTPTAGCMVQARFQHTANPLPDGRVLVAGGSDGSTSLAAAEIYDPGKNGWVATGSMAGARARHVSAPLPGGQVLVAGGVNGSSTLLSSEAFNPSTGSWAPAGAMISARFDAGAAALVDGTVLVAGGGVSPISATASAELYDPTSRSWTATSPMATARARPLVIALPGALSALAAGGHLLGRVTTVHGTAELYGYTRPSTPGTLPPITPGKPNLPTPNPTPVPGCAPTPHLVLDPPLVPAGFTTVVHGTGFCPGPVALAWDHGLGLAGAVADGAGAFTVRMLVLPREQPGFRSLVAAGTGGATGNQPFLVVPGVAGPPSFVERR